MSQENVEIVRKSFEAFLTGGIEPALAWYSPDLVIYPFPDWVEDSTYTGHTGFRRLVATWTDNFDDFRMEANDYRDAGERVVGLFTMAGLAKETGVPVRLLPGVVHGGFRDGTIGESRYFLTWQNALEAAGLAE